MQLSRTIESFVAMRPTCAAYLGPVNQTAGAGNPAHASLRLIVRLPLGDETSKAGLCVSHSGP